MRTLYLNFIFEELDENVYLDKSHEIILDCNDIVHSTMSLLLL